MCIRDRYSPHTAPTDIEIDESLNDEDDNDDAVVQPDFHYDLALIKRVKAGQVIAAMTNITYEIVVKNQGNVASHDFRVTDNIATGTTFVSASDGGTQTAPDSGMIVWAIPDLAPGVTKVLTLTVKLDNLTQLSYRNWAEISADSATDYAGVTKDEDSTPDSNTGKDHTDPNDPYITQRVCSALEMCRDVAGRAVIALLKQRSDDERVRRKRQETVIWEYRQASDDGDGSVSILLAIPDGAGGHS